MNWVDVVTAQALCKWASKVAAGTHISQGQRLDPLGTSMRHLGSPNVSELLGLVEQGKALPGRGGAGNQDEIDLRSMGLLEKGTVELGLTELGSTVLAQWRKHKVDDDSFGHELARDVVLVAEASRRSVGLYLRMTEFWREVRQAYDVTDLLKSPESLYLVSYLNQVVDDYNPWRVIVRARARLVADFAAEWKAIEDGTAHCTPDAKSALSKIRDRVVDFASRGDPRVVFCAAMELVELQANGEDVDTPLNTWTLPIG